MLQALPAGPCTLDGDHDLSEVFVSTDHIVDRKSPSFVLDMSWSRVRCFRDEAFRTSRFVLDSLTVSIMALEFTFGP